MNPANQFLWRHIVQRKWLYAGGLLSLLLTSITEVMAPKFAQWTLDAVNIDNSLNPGSSSGSSSSSSNLRDSLAWLAVAFIFTGFAGLAGRIGWRQTLARATHESGRMLRIQLWDQIAFLPMRFFREGSLGELMSRFSADVNQARMLFGFTLVLWLDCVFFTVFAFAAMFLISWRAGLACMIVIVAVPALLRNLARLEYMQHEKSQSTLASFSDRMAQNLSAIKIQRAGGTERFWSAMLDRGARLYASDRLRVLKTGLRIFPVTSGASLVCVAAVMITGWFDLHTGRIGAGGMFALFAYATMLQSPLFELADLVSELQRGRASLVRVLEVCRTGSILGSPESINGEILNGPANLHQIVRTPVHDVQKIAIRVRQLVVHSGISGHQGFRAGPLDFEVAPGEWLGISGRIGSGKSLLLATLAGIHHEASGTIEAQMVTFQPQRPFVFSGTVRENLELGGLADDRGDGDDAKIWAALETVALDEEIRNMPGGLEAYLHEGGINLSGGQRQRLTLARALLRESPVMLMDAPLSALDEQTEQKILGNLRRRLIARAVILVSHRPGVLVACDRIFKMGGGGANEAENEAENEADQQALHS